MMLKPAKLKTQTPPERLRELERDARGMAYEGWCKSMGIDYASTGWAQRIDHARREAEEYEVRQQRRLQRAWDEMQKKRSRPGQTHAR